MPRLPRIDYPGAWHHVMNRGARRAPVFASTEHCDLFFHHVERVHRRFGLEFHAYALMPNHFHLLVRSVRGNLSAAMKALLGPFTQALNDKHGWDGPVFRGRFRNQLVLEEEHLQILVPYIHINPLEARLVARLEDAHWNSYGPYVGVSRKPAWLSTDTVLGIFGSVEGLVTETKAYWNGELPWPEGFDASSGLFVGRSAMVDEQALSLAAAWREQQLEQVRLVVEAITGEAWSAACASRRGRGGNPVRLLAIHLLTEYTDLTHSEVARALETSASLVAISASRLRRGNHEPRLVEWMKQGAFWLETGSDQREPPPSSS